MPLEQLLQVRLWRSLAVLLEAIVFWNGMIRVYLTSVQLGLKHRVLAACAGGSQFSTSGICGRLSASPPTRRSSRRRSGSWTPPGRRARSVRRNTRSFWSTGCSSGTSAMSTTGAAFPRSSSATAQQCTTDSSSPPPRWRTAGGSWRTVSGRSWRRPAVRR